MNINVPVADAYNPIRFVMAIVTAMTTAMNSTAAAVKDKVITAVVMVFLPDVASCVHPNNHM